LSLEKGDKVNTAKVSEIPNCDFCGNPAQYDAQTTLGPWAFMCESDYQAHSTHKLGLGFGQKLEVA